MVAVNLTRGKLHHIKQRKVGARGGAISDAPSRHTATSRTQERFHNLWKRTATPTCMCKRLWLRNQAKRSLAWTVARATIIDGETDRAMPKGPEDDRTIVQRSGIKQEGLLHGAIRMPSTASLSPRL